MSEHMYVISIVADDLDSFDKAAASIRQSIVDRSVSAHTPHYGNGDGFGSTLEVIAHLGIRRGERR